MPNLVEITVRVKDEASAALADMEAKFRASGASSAKNFNDEFGKQLGAGGGGGGLISKLFTDADKEAEKAGQDASTGLLRGFQNGISAKSGGGPGGTSLLAGLFAGNTGSISTAAQQIGQQVGQDTAKGAQGGLLSNPWAIVGIGGAIAAAAPFISQMLSSVLVTALGAGIAAMAIYGASKSKDVVAVFKTVQTEASQDLAQIGSSFVPVLETILSTATEVMSNMTPIFADAAKAISGPFKDFATTLETAFASPAVKQSIGAVADAFAAILKAVTPTLSDDVNKIAQGITQMANAVAANPAAFAGFLTFLADVAAGALKLIANLTNVASYLEKQWAPTWANIGGFVKGVWTIITSTAKVATDEVIGVVKVFAALFTGNWTALWNAVKGIGEQTWNFIKTEFTTIWNAIVTAAKPIWNALVSFLAGVWNGIENGIHSAWSAIANFFSGWWRSEVSAFTGYGKDIASVLSSAWNGMKSTAASVWNAITGSFRTVWNGLKAGFNDTVGGIETAWNKLSGIFRSPVNFLIGTVYDNGLRRFWNDVMNAVGLGSLDLPQVATLSGGGKLGGFGGGDTVPALLEPGEAVVDKHTTAKFAPVLKAMGVPGFASGGVVGSIWNDITGGARLVAAVTTGNSEAFANAIADMFGHGSGGASAELASMIATAPVAMLKDLAKGLWGKIQTGYKTTEAQLLANAAAQSNGNEPGGPGGGAPSANAALARSLHPDWGSGPFWSAWNAVAMRESGWNQFATNPSSGAYGIPQALPYTKMPRAAWPASAGGSSNPTAQINWMYDYIRSVYGNPVNAWNHELSAGWYDNGGWLKPGLTLAYNGTGAPERVIGPGGGGAVTLEVAPGGDSAFEQFMVTAIRNWVRVKGGRGSNSVQQAFGQN